MTHSTRWLGTAGALAAASALVLTGCSAAGDTEPSEDSAGLTPVTLQLQWVAQAQFAGYYAAVDQGFYEDEGLDVTIAEGGADIVPQDVLASGDVDYAISWVPKVLGSIEQGANITNVAQIFERSATTQISFKEAGITSPADLAGKDVGSWGYGNEWELFAGMQQAGVEVGDISLVQQAFDMNAFLAGDIDAAQAMTYNEYAQVLETINPDTGELYQPDDINVIDWNDEGTAMLQDAIWANADMLADDEAYADQTVAFIKASIKGWIYAAENPEDAATIVADAGSALPAGHQLWMTNEASKLIFPSSNGVGLIDEDAWANTVDIAMNTENETGGTIITTDPPETAYSNEYVQQALDELTEEDVDVMGAEWAPIEVTLQEGGE
ncbi:ABC transporter substrate-binding protein [Cryobacterium sp. 1639]|uniref:ABC transporter substrate-binding protein n=1 Tax=Cryobacterium inferilacus TaxID=2866629 RepID=UPI001C73E02D|nr:ABC transporter substrate-binding protein [Cryobacterium sp. 1639]MBX0299042.1 ABC transporter substrate-binding protein [Cryobacterium sp. 1639]